MNSVVRRRLFVAGVLALMMAFTASARADFGVVPGSFTANMHEADGISEETRAGVHPADATFAFSFNQVDGKQRTDGRLKDTLVHLPAGIIGNPGVAGVCPIDTFFSLVTGLVHCPPESQLGVLEFQTVNLPNAEALNARIAVFNLPPGGGSPARLGIAPAGVPVVLNAKLRPSDYGVDVLAANTNAIYYYPKFKMTIWGVPASPVNDSERVCEGVGYVGCPLALNAPRLPFLTTGTQCGVANTTGLQVTSWEQPSNYLSYSYTSPSPLTDCNRLPFAPSLKLGVDGSSAGSPIGLSVDLSVPQDGLMEPAARASAHLRDAEVTLPKGVAVNASSADGLGSCSPEQIGLKTNDPVACPQSSKLGTIQIDTPLLDHPVPGSIYLATQGTNPFNSLLAMYVVAEDPEYGILLKLPGKLSADPQTGQLTATFDDNPQLPFENLHMQFKSGPRAALQMPDACGTYATTYRLTSWGGQTATGASSFTINQNCNASSQFKPGFEAGTTNPTAGSYSSFALRVTRGDGEQNVSRIDATLPKGVLAKLAGVAVCGDAQAATGNCPPASQVGTTTVGAGAGSNPLYVPQPGKAPTAVYLAGPYKGAPLSLVVKVPAQAGPFDLGTVAVRNALRIDPVTAQASVSSDPLPQILQGIPIAYRDIRVDVDRPGFTLNPTSCDPMAVDGVIGSAQGKSASVSSHFQVADCERLGFKPKLALSLSGAPTRRGGFPALRATLTMPKGGANIARAAVTLPKTEILEQGHIRTICTRVQYAAKACPEASVYGHAKAWSPLMDEPLQGPVYLRSSNHTLPDLVASLDGQIHIDLAGRIDSVDARIRNTFQLVPDAPVSKFVLTMQGGRKGLLVNNTQLCKAKPRAEAKFDAQNGKFSDSKPLVKVAGCGAKKGK